MSYKFIESQVTKCNALFDDPWPVPRHDSVTFYFALPFVFAT